MKHLRAMTNKRYVEKHNKSYDIESIIKEECPISFHLSNNLPCHYHEYPNECIECWNLPAKINGKYIMKEVK